MNSKFSEQLVKFKNSIPNEKQYNVSYFTTILAICTTIEAEWKKDSNHHQRFYFYSLLLSQLIELNGIAAEKDLTEKDITDNKTTFEAAFINSMGPIKQALQFGALFSLVAILVLLTIAVYIALLISASPGITLMCVMPLVVAFAFCALLMAGMIGGAMAYGYHCGKVRENEFNFVKKYADTQYTLFASSINSLPAPTGSVNSDESVTVLQ